MLSTKRLALILIPVLAAAVIGCKKEYDTPPVHSLPVGSVITIAQLRAMYAGTPVHFPSSMSVYAVVTADEQNGNLYKNVYVQDHTGAIALRLLSSGGLYQGDSIRIYLPGTVLSTYSGLYQLDSVSVDNNTVKQATLVHVEPIHLRLDSLVNIAFDAPGSLESYLVQIDSIEFISGDAFKTWADVVGNASSSLNLEDCAGNPMIVRTSNYANFAGQQVPTGKGSFTGILGRFNSTQQLVVRNLAEVQLTGPRCPGQELPFFNKDFNDASVGSGGWSQWSDTTIAWTTNTIGSTTAYGQVKNYVNSANVPCESWLISPSINLSTGHPAPQLSFITGCNYTGANLQVLVSTDYVSGAPSTGTWTALAPTLSPGTWTWTASGPLALSAFLSSNVHIGFKYTGTNSDGKTWEVDDIHIIDP